MDSTLNEFLNEIDELVPLKNTEKECYWKQCFDENSGFSYYWNVKTDEVTWEEPENFIPAPTKASSSSTSSTIPKPKVPKISSELIDKVKGTVKIYNITSNCNQPLMNPPKEPAENPENEGKTIKLKKPKNDLDDEKITLITSYGSDSDEESEEEPKKETKAGSDEDNDILSTVKKRAEELKGTKHSPSVSGFSLLAGYESSDNSNSEDEEETVAPPSLPIAGHSTLFPIVQPVNVEDFTTDKSSAAPLRIDENIEKKDDSFDTKNFQRKRRLGVSLPQTFVRKESGERKGLGFENATNTIDTTSVSKNNLYANFKSGGVEFVSKNEETESDENIEEIKENYEILHEKLLFLCEGSNKDVVPVQIINIQIETLFGALKANCLKPSYMSEWLKGTSEDLIKLEKEAAPDGWLLQWDRSQKRYYYHNKATGDGQWEFPDVENGQNDEAMDISTTPPHSSEPQPPLPPQSCSPTPPPPPIISLKDELEAPAAPKISDSVDNNQPLPPGVDPDQEPDKKVDINNAFTSFYSELAAIEEASNGSPTPSNEAQSSGEAVAVEPPKKKKKKIKLGQGLSLKKKEVSKLVEKWKSVQKHY